MRVLFLFVVLFLCTYSNLSAQTVKLYSFTETGILFSNRGVFTNNISVGAYVNSFYVGFNTGIDFIENFISVPVSLDLRYSIRDVEFSQLSNDGPNIYLFLNTGHAFATSKEIGNLQGGIVVESGLGTSIALTDSGLLATNFRAGYRHQNFTLGRELRTIKGIFLKIGVVISH
jgi:hypothetical protein